MSNIVKLKTTDGVTLVGEFNNPKGSTKAVLLLHMMPATRESFKTLVEALNKDKFATLAIDLRGHGESIERQVYNQDKAITLNYNEFADTEHQASRLDVDSAMNYLKSNGFEEANISFVGASIGANLCLEALDRYSDSHAAVLLSPGLDYRGIKTESSLKGLSSHQRVLMLAAEEDEYSADSVKQLQVLMPPESQSSLPIKGELPVRSKILKGSEHGTNLFKAYPELILEIVTFLNK